MSDDNKEGAGVPVVCAGKNCGTTTGDHSPECIAEHEAAYSSGAPTPPAVMPAAPSDAQIERMTQLAFAATNDRGEMGLQKYWYGKGVRDGAALASHKEAPATPQAVVWPDGTLLEPLSEDEVFRFMKSVGPRNSVTARALARYWKTHPAVALTQPTTVQQADDSDDLAARLLDRAKYIRDQGGVKSAELMEAAAAVLNDMQPGERKDQE